MKRSLNRHFLLYVSLLAVFGVRVEPALSLSVGDVCEINEGGPVESVINPCDVENPEQSVSPAVLSTQIMQSLAQQNNSVLSNRMEEMRDVDFYSISEDTSSGEPAGAVAGAGVSGDGSGQDDDGSRGDGVSDIYGDQLGLGFFSSFTATRGRQDDEEATIGFDSSGYSLTFGFDKLLSDQLVLGIALGASQEDAEFNSSLGVQDISLVTVSTFGNFYISDNTYFDWLLSYAYGDLDSTRVVDDGSDVYLAEANIDVEVVSAALTLGYDWVASEWEFSSYARADYTDTWVDGYEETGAFESNLVVDEQQEDVLETALGTRISHVISLKDGVIIPSFELEWVYRHDDDPSSVSALLPDLSEDDEFDIIGSQVDKDYFNASLSVTGTYAGGVSAYLRVDALLDDDYYSQEIYTAGLRLIF